MENVKLQIPGEIISDLFGSFDSNIKKIEQNFKVSIVSRNEDVIITGEAENIVNART
ncbi:MAG TPA: phosphate starvation-inducible protein PhoH, partial [Lachnospiraceae bacterium]|nr:phosphate starvation-inducible protein PhoH [Lachnospiraceae bacterium]